MSQRKRVNDLKIKIRKKKWIKKTTQHCTAVNNNSNFFVVQDFKFLSK